MPLPSLEKITPVFDIVIPSTGETQKFRAFLVKEEKILLMALQEDNETAIFDALCQVVGLCAMSPTFQLDKLAVFDIEYIFLKLRSRSVKETVDLSYRCHNRVTLTPEEASKRSRLAQKPGLRNRADEVEETFENVVAECNHLVTIQLNLEQVSMQRSEGHSKNILLTDTLGIVMKYPNIEMTKKLAKQRKNKKQETVDESIEGIALCVESVFDENNMFSNFSQQEMVEWINNLSQPQYAKIQTFFDTMPKMAHDLPFKCPACGYVDAIHLEGLSAFFG